MDDEEYSAKFESLEEHMSAFIHSNDLGISANTYLNSGFSGVPLSPSNVNVGNARGEGRPSGIFPTILMDPPPAKSSMYDRAQPATTNRSGPGSNQAPLI